MTLTFEEKYQAILNKDSSYEGLFITAVKTTGIFCRPVCTARKPKLENVEFFNSPKEALNQGYRPCKICRPLEHTGEMPEIIRDLLKQVADNPRQKLTDADLKSNGLEPNTVRRWFKKNYGITFQGYQRKVRLNEAHNQLALGKSVTHTAFDSGFESLSGFSNSFQKNLNVAPSRATETTIMHMVQISTPLGPMVACATAQGICLLEFSDRAGLQKYIEVIAKSLSVTPLPGANPHLESLRQQLTDYFQGRRKAFNLSLVTIGTDFQKSVWTALEKIPYGQTRTYSQQAHYVGNPAAVRAVASANGQNHLAIVIPCHRVIGKNGSLTGYAGGIKRKQWLLEHEQSG